jgi:mannose-1-phosphate guanylyltransferase
MNNSPHILILAGGAGTRFWPASREHLPKQFLDITGSGQSLIRQTVDRFWEWIPPEKIFIITHEQYQPLVRQHIPELPAQQILLEPSRNNTAPSIAYASLKLSQLDPKGVCVVAPADHIIQDETEFKRVIQLAIQHTHEQQSLITLGIQPTRPDTGYGYMEFEKQHADEIKKVIAFKEKPDLITAEQYLHCGNFVWNAGIFIWSFNAILHAFEQHAPGIFRVLKAGVTKFNTPDEAQFLKSEYPKTEKLSVDYAIMERASNVWTIPCDLGWSDLGTWNSLYEIMHCDAEGNVAFTNPVHLDDTQRSLILSKKDKLTVIKGLDDYIIIDTEDCLLIYPRGDEQKIRELKEELRRKGFGKYL